MLKQFPGNGSMLLNSILSVLYVLVGFPFFLFGFINNFLPYKIPGWISTKLTKLPEFYGAISMVAGTFTFMIFYSVQLCLVQHYFHTTWLTLSYLAALPLSGFFAFFYWKRFTNLRGRWVIFSLFYKRTNLITSLMNTRRQIIEELEKGRKDFLGKSIV